MIISELIKKLNQSLDRHGDIEVQAFQHEGGNSLRGEPGEIKDYTFEIKHKKGIPILYIGGWYF